jgi:hypothetical protein
MEQTRILIPMLTLAAWTMVVLLFVPYRRFKAVFARKVTANDFKFGESVNVPGEVSIPNRNFMNLLEVPLLFYVVCLTAYATHKVDRAALILAWVYVIGRILHSVVHLTYNKVVHRLAAFAATNVILVVLLLRLLTVLV